MQHLERLVNLERLERINKLSSLNKNNILDKLQIFTGDYRDVVIPQDSVIYCDIPYKDTKSGYVKGFNHEQFYEWARKQDNIFISEYTMPDDFIELDFKDKMVLSARGDNKFKAIERLYTNKRTYDKMSDSKKQYIENNHAIQMSFEDLM